MIYKEKIAKVLMITLLGGLLIVSGGCGKQQKPQPDVVDMTIPPVVAEEEPAEEEKLPAEPENPHEGQVQDLLNGSWIPEEDFGQRPIAIMLGNTSDALPQYGVGGADVLYECLVEGGLTRLMGIYSDYTKTQRYGSVRSCRLYYAYFAKEYDAIYAHYGQADNAKSFLNSDSIDNLSGLDGNIESRMYYRDSSRSAPHNVIATAEGIPDAIAYKGYRTTYNEGYTGHFAFSDGEEPVVLDGADAAVMRPGYPASRPWFVYDEATGTYKRYQYKKEHIDGTTGDQLTFTNVIFQFMDGRVIDKKGRMEFDTVGNGNGKYFTGGKVIDITWKKADLDSPALYYDGEGNQLVMNPGKTCICIITNSSADDISIYETEEAFQAAQ